MKSKILTKTCSTYYRKLKTLIPVKGKYEKHFLNNIFENLQSIGSEQPDISYNELCKRLGTPKDLIIEYYENADTEYIIPKMKISSIIRNVIIASLLLVVVVISVEIYSYHKLCVEAEIKNSMDDHLYIEILPFKIP